MNAPPRFAPPVTAELRLDLPLYACVGLIAGAVIALQIGVMRIFSVGNWAHFGSLVVSLAMLGFGLTSAGMCIATGWFERHWRRGAGAALIAFGPLTIVANLAAQQVPFNAIFLVSDPAQKWRLAANFVLYLLPFLAGAVFLGTMFLKAKTAFARVYFADLVGSGLCGLALLAAMYVVPPEHLLLVPLGLWFLSGLLWWASLRGGGFLAGLVVAALASLAIQFGLPGVIGATTLATSDYKGVAYARKFPDARRVYRATSPFGLVEVYASSYLHFAPGLSDSAAFNLPRMPADAYLGMYLDGDGPIGIIRKLPPEELAYFRYLPMSYPYLVKQAPETFVAQLGGGISTSVALAGGSSRVTVAEGNPAILGALRDDPGLRDFTGDILRDPRVEVVSTDGRLYVAGVRGRYDIVDLSLADSAGLSNPGGFAVVEKFAYTREAMGAYMAALKPGGILSVTLWNKEEPPKSVLKLYATMAAAARDQGDGEPARSFLVVSSYLSTATVLFKRGGFTDAEIAKLREHTRAMSFDEIYYPGIEFDPSATDATLDSYRDQIFFDPGSRNADEPPGGPSDKPESPEADAATLPSVTLGRLAWHGLLFGGWQQIADRYVFDSRALTNDRPYFAAYVRPVDLPKVTDRLELLQDEWGYLLVWATFGVACVAALILVSLPVAFGWRTVFSRQPGKGGTIVYFACLGLGYIVVEVGLIANFVLALSNATVSASVLITGMLVFSGIGSFVSERVIPRARARLPWILLAIGAILAAYAFGLDRMLDAIGGLPYGLRLLVCFAIVFPPAFLMGFPMPTAMASLARLGKDNMFIWAWGINGCFSVVGAALVPLVATSFGMGAVLGVAALAYLLAIPAFFAVLKPKRPAPGIGALRGGRVSATRTRRSRWQLALMVAAALTLGGADRAAAQDGDPEPRLPAGPAAPLPPRRAKSPPSSRATRPPQAEMPGESEPIPAESTPSGRVGVVPVSCTPGARSWLVPFDTAPFPYDGEIPDGGGDFLDKKDGARRGHTSPRGGVYFEDKTYSDSRVLLSVPASFDPAGRPVIVLFLHGNEARLERDVCRRQGVPRQLAASGLNAVLVAPQLAVDALDSSAGKFWQRGALRAFLAEAADQLARLGHPGLEEAPIVIAAYSGGYLPAVFGLQVGGVADRVRAMILLDALFGEVDRFGDTVAANVPHMAFVSAFSSASKAANATLRSNLQRRGVAVGEGVPGTLKPGVATFVAAPAAVSHGEFMTRGFAPDPLKVLLGKLAGAGASAR